MKKDLYEIDLKEFRKNYDYGDFSMLEYIEDYISEDLRELYTDVMNYNEIYANGWTIRDLFDMGKEDKYWIGRANNFISKYNVPKEDYDEFGEYFVKYMELRNELLDKLGLDERYLNSDKNIDDIPKVGFLESEIITNPKDFKNGFSYTVARVRSFGYCTELHYYDGEATIEHSNKISHDYWENEIEDADWFNLTMSETEIIDKLWELFDKHYGVDYENEL